MSEFEYELQELLIEIDMLIEKKKEEWEKDLHALEKKLSLQVSENNRLQSLVYEKERDLQDAFQRLQMVESKDSRMYYDKQIEELSTKVDAMKVNYNNLQRKYQKQLVAEKNDFSMHLRNLEKENEALKADYERLRQKNEQIISSLKQQVIDQQNNYFDIQKRYNELQSQFEVKLQEEINQINNNMKTMKEEHQSIIDELNKQLNNHKTTIQLQAEELMITKASLANKNSEIHCLSHETGLKKSVLNNSPKSVKRFDKTVAKHLNLLLHRKHNSTPNILLKDGSNLLVDSLSSRQQLHQPLDDQEEINHKIKYLENQLNEANNILIEKMLEISRLENVCQTASATIRRLVESKAYPNEPANKPLESFINEARERVGNFEKKLSLVEKDLSVKLSKTVSEICRLKQFVHEIHAFKSCEINQTVKNGTSDIGVQTGEHLLPNDELIKVTQPLTFNDKQSNNRTSSNLSINMKELNKNPSNFSTDLNSKLIINESNSNFDCLSINNTAIDRCNDQIGMEVVFQMNQLEKNCSHVKHDLHCNISSFVNSIDVSNESKNIEQSIQTTSNKLFEINHEKQILPSDKSDIVGLCKPIPSARFKLLSSSVQCFNHDNINSSGNELTDVDKHDYVVLVEPTSALSISEMFQSPEINTIVNNNNNNNNNNNSCLNDHNDAIRIVSTSIPHCSVFKQHGTFVVESDINVQCDRQSINSSDEAKSLLSFEKNSRPQLPSHCCSTLFYQSQMNLNKEDTSVYNLAAQFLIDEQKYSILLEQQIDAHLKCLQEHAENNI
ncbi:unnamed protein product [Schistosoma turkestanicum]|nr:unnamed protein product [Schistosoma turkestanicum]